MKSGLKSRCASSIASCSRSTPAAPARSSGSVVSACACSVARSRGSGRRARWHARDGVRRHLAPDEARELRQPRLDVGLLLRPELLEACDLHLGAQNVLLRALAHGVARARDALGFLPDVRLLVEYSSDSSARTRLQKERRTRGGDREALSLEALGEGHRVLRGDLLAEAALAGPGQGLAPHEAERRHRHLTEVGLQPSLTYRTETMGSGRACACSGRAREAARSPAAPAGPGSARGPR